MASTTSASNSVPPAAAVSPYQDRLTSFCRVNGLGEPMWQVMSDRRGGRTAWSCSVVIQGQPVQARFWYDGQFVNNAKEDAAQMALQKLGQIPSPGQPTRLQPTG